MRIAEWGGRKTASSPEVILKVGKRLGGMMDSLGLKRYNRPRPDLLWYLACTAASLFVSLAATAKAARTVASLGVADSIANAA